VNVQLERQASIEEAFAAVLRQCLAHLLANQAAAFEANLPEGLHQMRVALRRLRSAFLVFGRVIDGEREEDLMREAKWLTRAIGRARDYDVFTGDVIAPVMAKKPGDKGLQSLARAANAEREAVWAEARRLLAAPRTTRFVLQLALYLDTQGWRARRSKAQLAAMRAPVRKFAEAALDRRLKSVTKLARDIGELEVGDRHELRKRLKKLRYTMSFLATLYPADAVRSYLRRLSDLQNVFGALNDLEVAREIINDLGRKQPRLVLVGENVLAWHQVRARREWRLAEKFWVDFRDEPLFWRS
jgi:CHAD domain-containing protein